MSSTSITSTFSRFAPHYGALTTLFTPALSCLSDVYGDPGLGISLGGLVGDEENDYSGCYPTQFFSSAVWIYAAYYSPGLCPSGWTSATDTSAAIGFLSEELGQTPIPGETTAMCCPDIPDFSPNGLNYCTISTASAPITSCNDMWTATINSTVVETCVQFTTYTPTTSFDVRAAAVIVKYQSTDLPVLQKANPTWGIPQTSNSTVSNSTSISTTGSSPTTRTLSPAPHGLSQPAKIAIGVTIPMVFIALVFAAVVFSRRLKNNKATAEGGTEWRKAELPAERENHRVEFLVEERATELPS